MPLPAIADIAETPRSSPGPSLQIVEVEQEEEEESVPCTPQRGSRKKLKGTSDNIIVYSIYHYDVYITDITATGRPHSN